MIRKLGSLVDKGPMRRVRIEVRRASGRSGAEVLVLRRKPGERIVIGAEIEIVVLGTDPRGQIRIGVTAPRDVRILRADAPKGWKQKPV